MFSVPSNLVEVELPYQFQSTSGLNSLSKQVAMQILALRQKIFTTPSVAVYGVNTTPITLVSPQQPSTTMPSNDPRKVVGAKVHTLAIRVTSLAECIR